MTSFLTSLNKVVCMVTGLGHIFENLYIEISTKNVIGVFAIEKSKIISHLSIHVCYRVLLRTTQSRVICEF